MYVIGKSYKCAGGEIVTIREHGTPGMTRLEVLGLDGKTRLELEGPTENVAGFLRDNRATECPAPT